MRIALSILKWLTIVFLIFSISGILVYKVINPPFTLLMFKRVTEQIMNGEDVKLKHNWVSIDKISPNLVQAVISSEDGNFSEHYGVDFDAIQKAMKQNRDSNLLVMWTLKMWHRNVPILHLSLVV